MIQHQIMLTKLPLCHVVSEYSWVDPQFCIFYQQMTQRFFANFFCNYLRVGRQFQVANITGRTYWGSERIELRVNESLSKTFLILTAHYRITCIDTVLLANCWREKSRSRCTWYVCVCMHACVRVAINSGSDIVQSHKHSLSGSHTPSSISGNISLFTNPCCHIVNTGSEMNANNFA